MTTERPALKLQSILAEDNTQTEENWMLSYIDVFVLMTTLFVMLVVLNKPVETIKTETSAEENHQALIEVEEEIVVLPQEVVDLVHPPATTNKDWMNELDQVIETHALSDLVQLTKSEDYTELEISSRVLFDSGNAGLSRSGEAVLQNLLPVIQSSTGDIFIEGHTDDKPIETESYPSNWALASARATSVLQFFVNEGLPRERFRAVSYADTKPIAPNDSSANRSKNRRVSLVIHKPNTL